MEVNELEKLEFNYYENRDCWEKKLKSGIVIEYFTGAS